MNAINVVNLVLWGVQGFLALFFLAAGAPKLIGRGLERWTGFSDLPRAQVVFTGIMEVLGAAGLILPMATGILPWLTPLAAVGLAIIVLMASGFHQRANERLAALETVGQYRRRRGDRPLGSGRLARRRSAVGPGCGAGPAPPCGHHHCDHPLEAFREQRHASTGRGSGRHVLEQAVSDTPVTGSDQTASEQHRRERAGPAQTSRGLHTPPERTRSPRCGSCGPAQALHVLGRIRSL